MIYQIVCGFDSVNVGSFITVTGKCAESQNTMADETDSVNKNG